MAAVFGDNFVMVVLDFKGLFESAVHADDDLCNDERERRNEEDGEHVCAGHGFEDGFPEAFFRGKRAPEREDSDRTSYQEDKLNPKIFIDFFAELQKFFHVYTSYRITE